ncbi:phosphodiester glycosidase family protein [Solirubrobacter phytolaccae]|uniref:Phosphodiester glycosidase family protein n=1 Tax=Solirubrobacter phytolaccae TaxID=1404360 RepID=A0A9X3NAV7_9ACTN|nr:phosphodiester glycosidase family protein [Solirubrobacter phytolaccae]MDA0181545.1 phosphodiester glycosidase family protein [Solirubrobacter phytolaccae]
MRRALLTAAAVVAAVAVGPAVPSARAQVLPALDTSEQVGPDITLRHLQYPAAGGWVDAYVLRADLARPDVKLDLLHPPVIAQGQVLSEQAKSAGAMAGVNADFFDINNSYASQGFEVKDGALRKTSTPAAAGSLASVITTAGKALQTQLAFAGSITANGGTLASLAGVNTYATTADGIVQFTPQWGTYSRARPTSGASSTAEVLVRAGKVVSVSTTTPGAGAIPADGFYLVGRGAGATSLASLQVGDAVSVTAGVTTAGGESVRLAVSGGAAILRDGIVQTVPSDAFGDPLNPNPRTAIGFDRDATHVYLAVVDGRRSGFPGISQSQLGALLAASGAWNAQNLDGGGSSELLARAAGQATPAIRNVPSDGRERTDANGIGLIVTPGDGTARTLLLDPDGDAARSGGTVARVFPGARLRLRLATAVDAGWAPAPLPASVSWSTTRGTIDADGRLTAPATPGGLTVTATGATATGTSSVRVLGPLATITPAQAAVAFAGTTARATNIPLTGRDAQGFSGPLDAADTTLSFDAAVISATAASDGSVRIAPRAVGATLLRIRSGNVASELTVTVGAASPPALELPPTPDPLVASQGDGAQPWTFAALANPGIATADDAGADATVAALTRARAGGADFVLVGGGVTSAGEDGQTTAAAEALTRGGCVLVTGSTLPAAPAGKVPCVVTPGGADGGSFTTTFGPARRTFDHHGTRFVLLDSASGTLLDAGATQVTALATALDDAAANPAVDGVVVASYRPVTDALGDAARALTDPREGVLLEQALAGFAERSGKPVALLTAGSRLAEVRRVEGVAELSLPPLTAPRGNAARGGFTGWTRLTAGPRGLVADVHALADTIELSVPATLATGASTAVAATLTQATRRVPARFPLSPRWSGSGLVIGADVEAARALGAVAILDPATRTLTGLKAGTVTVAVDADGAHAEQAVQVTAAPVEQEPDPEPTPAPPGTEAPVVVPAPPGPPLQPMPIRMPSNVIRVLSAAGSSTALTFKVSVPGAGRLVVSAKATPKGRKAVTVGSHTTTARSAGTVKVTLKLSARTRAAIAKGRSHKATVKATLRFTPTGGSARTVTRSFGVTVRGH